jgi:hydroxymethylpyrimidine/phosphomethylpyrimidine kinase
MLNCSELINVSRFPVTDYTRVVSKRKSIPVALTIAGSDSGGGAGIQADLKTFAALGVHGTSVITCVTAQNPNRVYGVERCTPTIIRNQLEAVFDAIPPQAVKIGMLYSAAIIRAVADFFQNRKSPPLVVDPVMLSTSGMRLLEREGVEVLCKRLLPLAALITPNLYEAEILAGKKIRSIGDMRAAAKTIHRRFGCATLVKGGHLPDTEEAVDIYQDGRWKMALATFYVQGIKTHGTGCTFSSAIAAYLARGCSLRTALKNAKRYITQAIENSVLAHGHFVLGNGNESEHLTQRSLQKKLEKKMHNLLD